MNSSYNSITAKLYRWFYVTDKMPTNLCPYFWKCVLMYLLILPYTIFSLPSILLDLIPSMKDFNNIKSTMDRPKSAIGLYFILYLVISVIFTLIFIWSATPSDIDNYAHLYLPGVIISATTLIGLVGFLYTKNKKHRGERNKTDNITISFIKSRYNKYCPKINWVD